MKKKRLAIKDKEIKEIARKGGKRSIKKDFFELVRRAAKTTIEKS